MSTDTFASQYEFMNSMKSYMNLFLHFGSGSGQGRSFMKHQQVLVGVDLYHFLLKRNKIVTIMGLEIFDIKFGVDDSIKK